MGLDPTVVTPQEIEELLAAKYCIGSVQEIHPMAGGDNICYHIVTSEHDLVLKEMSVNGMNHPEMEPLVTAQLAYDAIPVPRFYPVMSAQAGPDISFIWEWNGKLFHLQQFVPGQIYFRNQAPAWLLWDSAELLGRIQSSLSRLPRLDDGMGPAWLKGYQSEWMRQSYQCTAELAESKGQFSLAADARDRLGLLPLLDRFNFDFDRLTCRNTHGDYRVQQLICGEKDIRAVIDLTSACVHPVIWEVIRSYTFADPQCVDGEIHVLHLKEYIARYLKHATLSQYDLRSMPYFHFYQLLRSNYIQQFFDADASSQSLALDLAIWSTKLCRWFAAHSDFLSAELSRSF
jgi:hypothetical protein